MDLRSLIEKMDAIELNEAFNIKTVQAAIQGQDETTRKATLIKLAAQNGLKGLYDPVTGDYVYDAGQGVPGTANTADKDTDYKLASMGLIPQNASTSTTLGRIFGTSGDEYDKGLRSQSSQVVANQTSEEVRTQLLTQLQDLMKQFDGVGKAPAGATPPATQTASGQSGSKKESFERGDIARALTESFGYDSTNEAIAPALAKVGGKALPVIGTVLGAYDAYDRFQKGDYSGAALSTVGAVATLIPPLGWVVGTAIGGYQAVDDYKKATAADAGQPGGAQQSGAQQGQGALPGDPKIAELQKKLKAKGADLGTYGPNKDGIDGKMGPYTKAAMQKYSMTLESQMSIAENMAALRARLSVLEDDEVPADSSASQEPAEKPQVMQASPEEMKSAEELAKIGGRVEMGSDGTLRILVPNPDTTQGGFVVLDQEMNVLNQQGQDTGIDFNQVAGEQPVAEAFGWLAKIPAIVKGLSTGLGFGARNAKMMKYATRPAVTTTPGQFQAAKLGGALARNPGKTAAGALAVGAGARLAGGSAAATSASAGGPGGVGGGAGGGQSGQGAEPSGPVCSPEQMAIAVKMRDVMGKLSDYADKDIAVAQFVQAAQSKLDAAKCDTTTAQQGQGAEPANKAKGTPLSNFYNNLE